MYTRLQTKLSKSKVKSMVRALRHFKVDPVLKFDAIFHCRLDMDVTLQQIKSISSQDYIVLLSVHLNFLTHFKCLNGEFFTF